MRSVLSTLGFVWAWGTKAYGKKPVSGISPEITSPRTLEGKWSCRLDPGHQGLAENWQLTVSEQHHVTLPGTTHTNSIGPSFQKKLISGLTPITNHIGPAWYWRDIELSPDDCKQVIELYLERCCWQTFAWLNGELLGTLDSLVSPHIYDLSPAVRPGINRLTIMVDNSNLKAKRPGSDLNVSGSEELSMAGGDDNRLKCGGHHTVFGGFSWNGITGRIELRIRPQVRIADLQVYPMVDQKKIRLELTCNNHLESPAPASLSFVVRSIQTKTPEIKSRLELECEPGSHLSSLEIELGEDMLLWDEFTPELYQLEVKLTSSHGIDSQKTEFGMRSLSQQGKQLAINGRPHSFGAALECFIHPITGYPPTDVDYWLRLFGVNKAHGLNHVSFHTCCPPEAAFSAADRLGIILNVELPGCSGGRAKRCGHPGVSAAGGSAYSRHLWKPSLLLHAYHGQ